MPVTTSNLVVDLRRAGGEGVRARVTISTDPAGAVAFPGAGGIFVGGTREQKTRVATYELPNTDQPTSNLDGPFRYVVTVAFPSNGEQRAHTLPPIYVDLPTGTPTVYLSDCVGGVAGGGGDGGALEPPVDPGAPVGYRMGWELTAENTGLASKGVTEAMLTAATYPDFGGNRAYPNVSGYQYRKKFTKEVAAAPGTVFEQCLFVSAGALVTPCGDGVVIKDSDLVNTGNAGTLVFVDPYFTGSPYTTTTLQNLRMTGGAIFVNVTNAGAVIEDVYGYNQTAGDGVTELHRDGFTSRGRAGDAAPIIVRRSWFDCTQPLGTTGALLLKDDEPSDAHPLTGVEIYDSMFSGTGYCMNFASAHGLKVKNCRTRPADSPNAYGSVTVLGDVSMALWEENHEWANNPANGYKGAELGDPSTGSAPVDPVTEEPPVSATTYTVFSGDYPHAEAIALHDAGGDIAVANSFHLTSGTASCTGGRLWLPAAAVSGEKSFGSPIRFAAWGGDNLSATPVRWVDITDPVEGWNTVTWSTPIPMAAHTPLWIGWSAETNWYMAFSPAPTDEAVSGSLPALRLSAADVGLGWGRSIYDQGAGSAVQGGHALWGVDITVTT